MPQKYTINTQRYKVQGGISFIIIIIITIVIIIATISTIKKSFFKKSHTNKQTKQIIHHLYRDTPT